MLIPKSFQLAGITVNVVQEDNLVDTKKCIGEARYSKQEIAIDTKSAPIDLTIQSYYHELIHWFFYILGEDKLRNNEKLVDTLAHLLYQYEKTKVYQDET
jgi:hypothetical protein